MIGVVSEEIDACFGYICIWASGLGKRAQSLGSSAKYDFGSHS